MGGSSSKASVTQNLSNNVLNTTDISSINKNIMNAGVNVLVKNAQNCSSAVSQNNTCNFRNMKIGGDLNITSKQANKAKVDFSCIQASKASSEMATSMIQEMVGNLNSLSGTQAASQLNASALASSNSGFLGMGASSSTDVNTNVTNNITNQTRVNIENIYEKNLNTNFSAETVNDCIGKTRQTNTIDYSGTQVGGYANLDCFQENTLEQVQKCEQLSEALNKTLEKTAQELGITVVKKDVTSLTTEMTAEATAESKSTGPIEEVGNAVSGILDSIGNIFGLTALGAFAPFAISACIVCICLILLSSSSVLVVGLGGKGGGEQNYSDTSSYSNVYETTQEE